MLRGLTDHSTVLSEDEWVGDGHGDAVDELPSMAAVTAVVLELEHVLCTNCDALRGLRASELSAMSDIAKRLCLGGEERIERLHAFLTAIHSANASASAAEHGRNVKCFVVGGVDSKAVLQLLKELGLLTFFVSDADVDGSGAKWISHVIGGDHPIAIESERRTHLILLKLLRSLQVEHDAMLYVGRDAREIEHLEAIKICKTFACKTDGLTDADMNAIQKLHF